MPTRATGLLRRGEALAIAGIAGQPTVIVCDAAREEEALDKGAPATERRDADMLKGKKRKRGEKKDRKCSSSTKQSSNFWFFFRASRSELSFSLCRPNLSLLSSHSLSLSTVPSHGARPGTRRLCRPRRRRSDDEDDDAAAGRSRCSFGDSQQGQARIDSALSSVVIVVAFHRRFFFRRCLRRLLLVVISLSLSLSLVLPIVFAAVQGREGHLRAGDVRRARRRRLDGAARGARRRADAHRGRVPGAPRGQGR